MSKANKEKAKKYYPAVWNKTMLKKIVQANKLTKDEYEEITGEPYEE